MIYSFIQFIEHIVIPLGALGVFFAEVIEEIIVPIPSALILFTSGFVLLKGNTSFELLRNLFFIITLPGALGLTLGSTVIYCLGFYGGKPFIEKYGNYLGINWSEILVFDEKMNKSKYDEVLFIFARILPVVPSSLVAVFSGLTRMPIRKYLLLTFLASVVKASIYAYIGYKVGEVYYIYARQISNMENTGFVLFVLLILAFIGYRIYRKYYK